MNGTNWIDKRLMATLGRVVVDYQALTLFCVDYSDKLGILRRLKDLHNLLKISR